MECECLTQTQNPKLVQMYSSRVCRISCGSLLALELYSSSFFHLLPGGYNLCLFFFFPVLPPLSDEAIIVATGAFSQPSYFTSLPPSNILFVPQLKIGLSFINRDDTVTLLTFSGLCSFSYNNSRL